MTHGILRIWIALFVVAAGMGAIANEGDEPIVFEFPQRVGFTTEQIGAFPSDRILRYARPVTLTVSHIDQIKSATLTIAPNLLKIERIINWGEFDITFEQFSVEKMVIYINRIRDVQYYGHEKLFDMYPYTSSWGPIGNGIGEFEILDVELETMDGVERKIETINGSWKMFSGPSDTTTYLHLDLIPGDPDEPLSGYNVVLLGFDNAPLYYKDSMRAYVSDEKGQVKFPSPLDFDIIFSRVTFDCVVPNDGMKYVFLFHVEPPAGSKYQTKVYPVPLIPNAGCYRDSLYSELSINLSQPSGTAGWKAFQ